MLSPSLCLYIFLTSLILPSSSNPLLPPRNSQQSHLPLPVKILHQFPLGTWLENLAIRKNGKILTTAITSPELFQVDNRGDLPPTLVHRFAGKSSCFGITELGDDIFYVIAGNLTFSTFTPVVGSYAVYEVNLRNYKGTLAAPVTKIAQIPGSQLANGITVLSHKRKTLLVGDSILGVIYRIEIQTGTVTKVLDQPLFKGNSPQASTGVNGLVVRDGYLFFANTNQNLLAKIAISQDGTPKSGAVAIIVNKDIQGPDDFSLAPSGGNVAVIAQNSPNKLGLVRNGVYTEVAGNNAAIGSVLMGPTAVEFARGGGRKGRHNKKVYISTTGGAAQYFSGNITVPGTISSVDLSVYL